MKHGFRRTLARLFVVQGSLNYDRMIAPGVAWAGEPLLRDLPGGVRGPAYTAALRRATQFFNAHPYLVGLAIGATARAEYDEVPGETIARLRITVGVPLGSVGDKLVWAGVLPVTLGAGIVLAVSGHPVAGVLVFLALYNAVHVALRVWGLKAGWELGPALARALGSPVLQLGLRIAGPAAGLMLGFTLPVVGASLTRELEPEARIGVLVVALVGLVVGRWLAPGVNAVRLGLAALAIALVLGWLWPS